jgi:hypothetical protein
MKLLRRASFYRQKPALVKLDKTSAPFLRAKIPNNFYYFSLHFIVVGARAPWVMPAERIPFADRSLLFSECNLSTHLNEWLQRWALLHNADTTNALIAHLWSLQLF